MPTGKPAVKRGPKPKGKTRSRPAAKPKASAKPKVAKPVVQSKPKAPTKAGARRAVRVVGKVLAKTGDGKLSEAKLFAELENLAKFIQEAKAEIAYLRPDEVKQNFLPTASDELDAIVEATADATNAIMDATETLEEVMSSMQGEAMEKMMTATTMIYEACGFQDITGQRITKIVKTLQDIEEKVDALLAAFDGDAAGTSAAKQGKKGKKAKRETKKEITDADLLNGPQSADKAKSQGEIDALFAGFD